MVGPAAGVDRVVIDGHVHLRDAADDAAALAAAVRNFAEKAPPGAHVGVLMMAEAPGEQGYARLRNAVANGSGWVRGALTAEAESFWLDIEGWRLLIVAGRQIVTAERLEVLALATAGNFDNGCALDGVLERIDVAGGVAVLPWGCGKWLGRRRRILEAVLRARQGKPLLLGDNAGRPAFWPEPQLAESAHRRVLRGTDPLPLPRHWRRIGSFGTVLAVVLSERTPAADLRRALRNPAVPLRPYGELQRPTSFALDQLRLCTSRMPVRLTGEAVG